jgi:hypothetical protein
MSCAVICSPFEDVALLVVLKLHSRVENLCILGGGVLFALQLIFGSQ